MAESQKTPSVQAELAFSKALQHERGEPEGTLDSEEGPQQQALRHEQRAPALLTWWPQAKGKDEV